MYSLDGKLDAEIPHRSVNLDLLWITFGKSTHSNCQNQPESQQPAM